MNALFRHRLTRPALVTAALLFVLTVSSIVLVPADALACEEESWRQTFYAEAEKVNVVGECWRPCYGWPSCSGSRSDYYDLVSWSCGACVP